MDGPPQPATSDFWPCPECGYSIRGSTQSICPECGVALAEADRLRWQAREPVLQRRPLVRKRYVLLVGATLVALVIQSLLIAAAPGIVFDAPAVVGWMVVATIAFMGVWVLPFLVFRGLGTRDAELSIAIWREHAWAVHLPWVGCLAGSILVLAADALSGNVVRDAAFGVGFFGLLLWLAGSFVAWIVWCWRVQDSLAPCFTTHTTQRRRILAWLMCMLICWAGAGAFGLVLGGWFITSMDRSGLMTGGD